jgi:HTH-type transcriptional regulator, sugar sensing transcriptional regulator
MEAIQTTLAELGLGDKEIAIYTMLLKVGTSPTSSLAQRTRIVRSTTQYTCQQLVKKGIANVSRKDGVFLFTAEPPERLLSLLEKRRDALRKQEAKVQKIIGPLKQMMNVNAVLPKVHFYDGKDGMIQLYESILDIRQRIDSFEDKGEMVAFIPEYTFDFIRKRVKRGIVNRIICPEENTVDVASPKELREVRTLPAREFPFSGDIKICGDLVSIFSFQEHASVGIAIHHKEIADNFRVLFEAYWRMLGGRKGG